MSVEHNAIPWLRKRGQIDHAIAAQSGGWYTTGCGIWTPSGEETREPKRKCRKCVEGLKMATLHREG